MSVYTVKVSTRPRPTVTKTRRKLHGIARQICKAAAHRLQQALNHDSRITGRSGTVAAAQLIFAGDATAMAQAAAVVTILNEALASTLKIIKK